MPARHLWDVHDVLRVDGNRVDTARFDSNAMNLCISLGDATRIQVDIRELLHFTRACSNVQSYVEEGARPIWFPVDHHGSFANVEYKDGKYALTDGSEYDSLTKALVSTAKYRVFKRELPDIQPPPDDFDIRHSRNCSVQSKVFRTNNPMQYDLKPFFDPSVNPNAKFLKMAND